MKQGVPVVVAGIPLHHEELLHKLQSYSSHHGKAKPTNTTHYFQNRLVGVSKGIEIPLLNL